MGIERRFETEKYSFEVWVDSLSDVVRANVRLTRDERHRRGDKAITVKEIADQLKNIEKWETLKEASQLLFEIIEKERV